MQSLENITVAFTLLALVGLSLWLDATFDPSNVPREATTQPKGEDYYIEGVRISGRDENGIRFVLKAERQHRDAENDFASTTVDEALDATATTITLASVTHFATGGGVVTIESEDISYSGISGKDLTGVLRGINGTTATSHADGTVAKQPAKPAILEHPELTQFDEQHGDRTTTAERGEIKADGSEITLTGNVRIVQEQTTDRPNTVTETKRLTIRLASKG